jgi:hypothetical protein
LARGALWALVALAAPYLPRRPQETVLYELVKTHWSDFVEHAREASAHIHAALRLSFRLHGEPVVPPPPCPGVARVPPLHGRTKKRPRRAIGMMAPRFDEDQACGFP